MVIYFARSFFKQELHRCFMFLVLGCAAVAAQAVAQQAVAQQTVAQQTVASQASPNIVYILADDLGYGDLGVYNKKGKIATPHLDRLAAQGMRFTDAHSPSSVCTPTRYAILTGRYPWRSQLPVGVLRGYSRPLMESNRATVASMLKEKGYTTAVIGKWHLGLGWAVKPSFAHLLNNPGYGIKDEMNPDHIDFDEPMSVSPMTHGFQYSYVLPASLDMPPYGYVQNGRLEDPLTGYTNLSKPDTGYAGAFWRAGLMSNSFDFFDVLPNFIRKACGFIRDQKKGKPFFLYLPLAAPHTPWMPTDEFRGRSKAGEYGDFVEQVDAAVGKVLHTLDSMGLSENTLVVFTSDNGPYWRADYIEKYQHRSAGPFRGMKGDAFEGGHRVPFLVRWPGKVKAGTVSAATTTLANLMATAADLAGVQDREFVAEDSYSILPVLMGKAKQVPLQPAVVHSSSIGYYAIRMGDWKLIEGLGSGGFTVPKQINPSAGMPSAQLYNLKKDIAETVNLYDQYPDQVARLRKQLQEIKEAKRRIEIND